MIRSVAWVIAVSMLVAACGGGGGGGGGGGVGLEDLDGDGQIIILAFGDSITRGTGDGSDPRSTPPGAAGFPARVEASLGVPVYNAGKPGERTDAGVRRLQSVLGTSRADYVILLEGVNDIGVRRSTEAILADLQSMVDLVFQDGALPLVSTLTPACCQHEKQVPSERLGPLNDGIRAMATTNGIPLVDFHAAFVPDPALPFDPASGLIHVPEGLHPTPAGYDRMAETVVDVFL